MKKTKGKKKELMKEDEQKLMAKNCKNLIIIYVCR